jgi:hypothetical protein
LRESREIRGNSILLGAISPGDRTVGLALRADTNLGNSDRWPHCPQIRKEDSDNSSNNARRDNRCQEVPGGSSVVASNINLRNPVAQENLRQHNLSPEVRRESYTINLAMFNSERIGTKL